jgi:hypothetical protein
MKKTKNVLLKIPVFPRSHIDAPYAINLDQRGGIEPHLNTNSQ